MSTTQRRRVGRTRTACVTPDGLGFEIFVDFKKPRTLEALAAKDAINAHSAMQAVAGVKDAAEAAEALAASNADEAAETDSALRDLAAICADAIKAIRYDEDGELVDLLFEDYDDKPWQALDDDERAECAEDNADVCVWSIAFEIVKGAYPTKLGELSARRSTGTRRT